MRADEEDSNGEGNGRFGFALVPSADNVAAMIPGDPFQVDFSLDIDTGPPWTGEWLSFFADENFYDVHFTWQGQRE